MSDFQACYSRLRALGYSRRASIRIGLWACDPTRPYTSNPENTK